MNNINCIEVKKSRYDVFLSKLAQLNKLATRIGNEPLEAHIIRESERKVRINQQVDGVLHFTGNWATFVVCHVAVIGVAPVYANCTVAGYVESLEGMNLVHTIGEVKEADPVLSQRLRDWAGECDHCGSKRTRKGAFGIYRDGQLYLVGNSCVAQFVGRAGLNPKHLGEYLWSVDLLGDEAGDYSYGKAPSTVDTYVAFVLAATAISHVGYTSKKAAAAYAEACDYDKHLTTTSEVMSQELVEEKGFFSKGLYGCHPDLDPTLWEHTESDHAVAAAARDWALNLSGKSDFEYNLINISKATRVPVRRFGFVAAAVQGYLKSIGEAQTYEAKPKAPESQWVGTVGQRGTFANLTVVKLLSFPGFTYDSVSTLHKFVDAQGNKLAWFKSGSPDVAEGDVVTIKGTVKAQKDDPKWGKETQLSRCAIQ